LVKERVVKGGVREVRCVGVCSGRGIFLLLTLIGIRGLPANSSGGASTRKNNGQPEAVQFVSPHGKLWGLGQLGRGTNPELAFQSLVISTR